MNRSGLIDIECQLHHETKPACTDEGAFLVSLDGDRKRAVWVPKSASQVEHKGHGIVKLTLSEPLALAVSLWLPKSRVEAHVGDPFHPMVSLRMPERLAREKGLVRE